jgi:DNA mismatch endonuclease (patch repair protein)
MDIVAPAVRSRMMAMIKGSNTKPELAIRSMLHSSGFRFRLHRDNLPGRPDMVLPKHRLAILVHGCFWHQHAGCRYAYSPRSNREFWQKKLAGNLLRDRRVLDDLHELGWRTLVVWECCLKKGLKTSALRRRLEQAVVSKAAHREIPNSPCA